MIDSIPGPFHQRRKTHSSASPELHRDVDSAIAFLVSLSKKTAQPRPANLAALLQLFRDVKQRVYIPLPATALSSEKPGPQARNPGPFVAVL